MPDTISFETFCAAVRARVGTTVLGARLTTGAVAAAGLESFVEPAARMASWSANGFTVLVAPTSLVETVVILATEGGRPVGEAQNDDLTGAGARRVADVVRALLAAPE